MLLGGRGGHPTSNFAKCKSPSNSENLTFLNQSRWEVEAVSPQTAECPVLLSGPHFHQKINEKGVHMPTSSVEYVQICGYMCTYMSLYVHICIMYIYVHSTYMHLYVHICT